MKTEAGSTDRIEKRVVLRAARSRVWRALTDAEEFGTWFQAKLDGAFVPGARLRGNVTACGHENVMLEMVVERMEPEGFFSFRWHPYPIDPAVDYSGEPMTLVEFRLTEAEGGTALEIVESGFDRVPASRRAEAFRMNDAGWSGQIKSLERHVASK